MPDLPAWRWALGAFCAFMIGVAKTGAPGIGTMIAPLIVMTVGDARHAAAWAVPILSTADVFAVTYWRRHTAALKLFSLVPWVVVGMAGGAVALTWSEPVVRRTIGVIVVAMVVIYLVRRRFPSAGVGRGSAFFGVATGFSSTVANAAGPVMNLYLLSQKLPKEKFVATGAWFFLVVNLAKMPIYAYHGLFSRQSLLFDLFMVPAVLAGALAGLWIIHRIPQALFEVLVIVLTGLSSLVLFR
jgi:hypothetical protein